ncbi:MAG: four helix bundle protein [Alloprevotella sp.]|nr:four helix bundle protein [Alloprevotella sp.]
MDKGNQIVEKSYYFAIRIVKMTKLLTARRTEDVLTRQILKSGTAVGALISEAVFAQSKADFINKYSIALKEANETKYWLDLFHDTEIISEKEYASIYPDCVELVKILVAILNTLKASKAQQGGMF